LETGDVIMETLLRDIRYGVRSLLKRPGFTAIGLIALALGIGANTAIFSLVNAVLLRPLPFAEPDRLVWMWGNIRNGGNRASVSPLDFLDYRKQTTTFEEFAATFSVPVHLNLTGEGEPERLTAAGVTGNFFRALGATPEFGRTFQLENEKPGSDQVAVLSYRFWQRHFGGDPGIVNKTITLDGRTCQVLGVMPQDFSFPSAELWVPINFDISPGMKQRKAHFLRPIGKLKSGVTLAQAQADTDAIARRLEEQYPDTNTGWNLRLVSLREQLVGNTRPTLFILFGAVGFVLLIACANVANLLLVRAAGRQKEIALRTALGAGRWRLIRQLLTESVLVSLAGGAVAVLLAIWGTSLLVALQPDNLPRLTEIGVDGRVLAFTFGVSLLTGLIFGLLPAWAASRSGVSEGLKEGGRSATAGGARQRLRSTFVVLELAIALVLLIGAGLLIKTIWILRSVEPGFNPEHLLTMTVELPEARYKDVDQQTRFRAQTLENINSLPGLQAAMVSELPLSGNALDHDFLIDGRPPLAPGDEPSLQTRSVMGDYFHVMQIPLRAGRNFSSQDFAEKAPLVGVANEATVRQYFANEDPLGKRIRWARDQEVHWITIVGVVGDLKHFGLDLPDEPTLYSPYTQISPWKRWMTFVARSQPEPTSLVRAVKQQIWKVDSQLPISNVKTMSDVAALSFAARRFNMLLLAIFAGLALVLAAVGIYGVMSYSVTQRTQEIGIRMALGARATDVLKLIIRNGMTLTLMGVIIGLAGAFALTRLLTTLLFGVKPTDTPTFVAVSAVLILVALLACYLPARRATKVDPLVALRYE